MQTDYFDVSFQSSTNEVITGRLHQDDGYSRVSFSIETLQNHLDLLRHVTDDGSDIGCSADRAPVNRLIVVSIMG